MQVNRQKPANCWATACHLLLSPKTDFAWALEAPDALNQAQELALNTPQIVLTGRLVLMVSQFLGQIIMHMLSAIRRSKTNTNRY